VVSISGPAGEQSQQVDGQGKFTFPNLTPGQYQITASARWYRSVTYEMNLLPGETISPPFQLSKEKGTIEGRVLAAGQSVDRAELEVSYAPTGWCPPPVIRYTEDSIYSVEVDAGHWFVFVDFASAEDGPGFSWDSYNETAPSLVVEPGTTVTHDVIVVPLMEVKSIDVWQSEIKQEGETRYIRYTAPFEVSDSFGPLSGVKVYGHWDGLYSDSVSADTDDDGCVSFMTNWVELVEGVSITFTVDDLEKTGWEVEEGNLPYPD
jgi:hypothetical protein